MVAEMEASPDPKDHPVLDQASMAAILASIGDQVRAARQARGWYLIDLAQRLAMSTSVLCRLELARREASLHQMIMVCAAMGKRLSDVLRIAEDEAFPLDSAPWR